jgi:golgin subfamily B member 1
VQKKKKGKVTAVEESPANVSQGDPPPGVLDVPDTGEKQPGPALTPDEEAELQKLQTKKDIGSKMSKKQTDRYKILTDKVEEAAKAAEALASGITEPTGGDAVDLLDTGAAVDAEPADGSAFLDDVQAEAVEKARIIQEEEEEMTQLRAKKKPKKADKDRLRILEDRADERLREAEEKAAASGSNGQDDAAPGPVDTPGGDSHQVEDPAPEVDPAQAEADEKARIVEEEEEEMAELRAKKKLKRADKDRLQELEDRAASRAREAEEMAAAARAEAEAVQAAAAQAEADEKARIIQEEEEEMAQLRAKKKLKSADKERLRILEENADLRTREAESAQPDEPSPESGADSNESKSDETALTSVDDAGAQADQDEAARLIEEEELELEMLLSKSKLKKADKTRLKELQDNKEKREQDAAAKADAAAVPNIIDEIASPPKDAPAGGDIVEPNASEGDDLAEKLIEEEELELELLLSKSKLKKAEKTRLKELQDNKDQRAYEAAAKAASEPTPDSAEPPADGVPDSGLVLDEAPVDETATQDALIVAEESELVDLLSKAKLKKAEKARLKELQDRKDQRDEEARIAVEKAEEDERLAREKAEQEARELEERKRREEVEAEETEIASLRSKKKLKRSEKDRLAELEFRAQDRASAEAEKLAAELVKEDAGNESNHDESKTSKGLSWADDDPADQNGAGDDWMDWGLSSSKKSKKKDGSSPLIEFGGTSDAPAVPDAPIAISDAQAFDFGWGKPKKKDVQTPADDLWSFGGSSKKKSKNTTTEVLDDPIKAGFMGDTRDKMGGDEFWSTFGVDKKDKSSRKSALAMLPPPPAPTPPNMDLTETEVDAHDGGDAWDDPSGSMELSGSKSKSSDKDSKKSSKEPKLSKKELEKLEKEKKKAEKEQREREKREAEEAAEKERIAEEERLAAEAKAEEERLAREAEERARREEEAKQAVIDAIALEEADLAVLQAKRDSGKKLTKRDKERYDQLSASCQARVDEKAAQEAAEQAARDEEERLAREAEELARQQEIEKEDTELQELQKKKDSGRKLLKKDKERYDLLRANKKARDAAAEAASAPKDEAAPTHGDKAEDDLDKDLAGLDANQLDELDQILSSPTKTTTRAAEVDPFDFWGASKKSPKPKKAKSPGAEPVSALSIIVTLTPLCLPTTYPSTAPSPQFPRNTNACCGRPGVRLSFSCSNLPVPSRDCTC